MEPPSQERQQGSVHRPVLLNEVLEVFEPVAQQDAVLVDATLGLGGHSEALLTRYPLIRMIGIDRDPQAMQRAKERLERFGNRVQFAPGRYEALIEILETMGEGRVDGVIADLGVSSLQLDDPQRGFSFRATGPLDMRMGGEPLTAADLVNQSSEEELSRIIREYGEEPMARRIARAIVRARGERPIETTTDLVTVIRSVKRALPHKIDPSTLTFQALRIAVNEELQGLQKFIEDAVGVLKPGGRIAVISFHSLEDRIVKRTLRKLEGECVCPPNLPVCGCGAVAIVRVFRGGPVEADDAELRENPRSRSAKMRVAERVEDLESEV